MRRQPGHYCYTTPNLRRSDSLLSFFFFPAFFFFLDVLFSVPGVSGSRLDTLVPSEVSSLSQAPGGGDVDSLLSFPSMFSHHTGVEVGVEGESAGREWTIVCLNFPELVMIWTRLERIDTLEGSTSKQLWAS